MNSTPKTLETLRKSRTIAEHALRIATGGVVAAVRFHRRGGGSLPPAIGEALATYDAAYGRADAASEAYRARLEASRAETGGLAGSQERARVSALVASVFMDEPLVDAPGRPDTFRWLRLDEDGRQRPVANYASDHAAIAVVIASLSPDMLKAFGERLVGVLGSSDVGALVTASPFDKCRALLAIYGMSTTAAPVTMPVDDIPVAG